MNEVCKVFGKILIANRGEIAVRLIRTLRDMGIGSVAIYSEVDRKALHVQMADEAVCIGPPEPTRSYLDHTAIIRAARTSGVEAIHPGYGFLAENPDFAKKCTDAGITFIGPGHEEIRFLGNKLKSREKVTEAGIPIIPGMVGEAVKSSTLLEEAEKIGFPVMIKAASGGGGKGMRVIQDGEALKEAFEGAMREADFAFGDSSVYLEKYIQEPRHIEFQILADHYGNIVHLFERECSIQRRHQKIVEESPSAALNEEKRREMARAAVDVVRAVGYRNAGTVEFLVDGEGRFYFLEVNTRLQVEHPVTELIAGVDLVKEQIKISAGLPLDLSQEDLTPHGHVIECRIYAEDPENDFLPSFGKVGFLREPEGIGVRVDSGMYSGCDVPMYYDPILSKVIVWGQDRETARKRMKRALLEYRVLGIKTTIDFLTDLMDDPDFAKGLTTTETIPRFLPSWKETKARRLHLREALIAAAIDQKRDERSKARGESHPPVYQSPWERFNGWRILGSSPEGAEKSSGGRE
ncbi:MAG: acetyl/propionyl/methylcrotonyl-CoA carboxylase subunit alpha [Candidatus Glassbacteria bacterium]